jgi:hypothetical protein
LDNLIHEESIKNVNGRRGGQRQHSVLSKADNDDVGEQDEKRHKDSSVYLFRLLINKHGGNSECSFVKSINFACSSFMAEAEAGSRWGERVSCVPSNENIDD